MSEVIGIGAAPRRKEDLRFLTGRGNYVADIERPEMVAGIFVRSPRAHAKIKSIDTGAARAMPGVLAVFIGADLKTDGVNGLPCGWGIKGKDGQPMKEPPHPAMAQDKVRYVGDAVAFVVAENVQQARTAAEALAVDYHVLPAVIGLTDAVKPEAALVFDDVPNNLCCDWDLGDKAATDAAFKRAAHIARIKLVNNRLVGNPMEPRAAIAEFHPETRHYTLWSTSQFPHVVRQLARRPQRVVTGFGMKFRNRRPRLHRVTHQAVVYELDAGNVGGPFEGGVGGGLVAEVPVAAQIVGDIVEHECGFRLDRIREADDGRQHVVIHRQGLGRGARLLHVFGDHEGDRIADIAHLVLRHGRMRRLLHRLPVLTLDAPTAGQPVDA